MLIANFRVITTGRNSIDWIWECMASVCHQDYPEENIKVCVVDDASTDDSSAIIWDFCRGQGWKSILNTERHYALCNQYNAIHQICDDPDDVIVFVDADDRLNGPDVFSYLNDIYQDPEILLTYGSYATNPPSPKLEQPTVRPYPEEVIANRSFREFTTQQGIWWNHLRTFRYGPFTSLKPSDFQYPGTDTWFKASPDTAIMTPMLELVGARHKYIKKELLVYNTLQAEPDWRTHASEIHEADSIIFAAPKKDLWKREDYARNI